MPQSTLPQVKHIVFLMLENRSLDNVLGWLYGDSQPQHWYPPARPGIDPPHKYDGLVENRYSNPSPLTGEPYDVRPISDEVWDKGKGYAVPYLDPWEALQQNSTNDPRPPSNPWSGVINQFFGDSRPIPGLPAYGTPPTMKGFWQDYNSPTDGSWDGHDILWTYTPQQLPVINGLAAHYAVSDRWFSSLPSETNPNRAYSICGTSCGQDDDGYYLAYQQYELPTVFQYLAQAGKRWGLYFSENWVGNKSYTEYTFPQISRWKDNSEICDISEFFQRAQTGQLLDFTYIEPKWGYGAFDGFDVQGDDYHPPTHVNQGEAFLYRVYQAVYESACWAETLLIVTFDEHGGTYDHVPPPWGAINPDGKNNEGTKFKFDLFGVRVPTILISPFVRKSTVFRPPLGSQYPFDHTSFIKTLLGWAGVDPSSPNVDLGKRMPQAPSFEHVLADQPVNTERAPIEAPSPVPAAPFVAMNQFGRADLAEAARQINLLLERKEISVVATRAILARNNTAAGIEADIQRYQQDPQKFEAEIIKPTVIGKQN
jgi:phospholipase C